MSIKERPILFSGPMVAALLAGRKTQTRRLAKPPKGASLINIETDPCPYGVPGDRLWVKEAWKYADWTEDGVPWIEYAAAAGGRMLREPSEEWGDRVSDIWAELSVLNRDGPACDRRWRPSIHMPRWASRLTLEVTRVRVERVQDIDLTDALAEGMHPTWNGESSPGVPCPSEVDQYADIWDHINGAGSWDANPWVWAIDFKVIRT